MRRSLFEKMMVAGLLVLGVGVALFLGAAVGWVVRPSFYFVFLGGGGLLVLAGILGAFLVD